jgi:hypothetical protein
MFDLKHTLQQPSAMGSCAACVFILSVLSTCKSAVQLARWCCGTHGSLLVNGLLKTRLHRCAARQHSKVFLAVLRTCEYFGRHSPQNLVISSSMPIRLGCSQRLSRTLQMS